MDESSKVTDFQAQVFAWVSLIPPGKVVSYQALADWLDSSPRAVGQALKHNPRPIDIPCHRVVRKDGRLGGYFGATEGAVLAKKIDLLKEEGVIFQSQTQIAPESFINLLG